MKTNLIILIPLIFLSACGKKGEIQNSGNTVDVATTAPGGAQDNTTPVGEVAPEEENLPPTIEEEVAELPAEEVSPPVVDEPTPPIAEEEESKECFLSDLEEALPAKCHTVYFGKELIAGNSNNEEGITLIASKRNGGKSGSKWFDSSLELSESRILQIPSELQVNGNGGNGQKVYILINGSIDCVWTSHGAKKYRNPVCMIDAKRNPSDSTGFSGGSKVEKIPAIKSLKMTVNGAQGNGVLTTVTAQFSPAKENDDEDKDHKEKECEKEDKKKDHKNHD